MINQLQTVTAFAPATTANVAVGFDILGFALEELGDRLCLTKTADEILRIESIDSKDTLPFDALSNTATIALQAMLTDLGLRQGFKIHLKKGIPLSSGLGGSAASSVAAVVACNHFLKKPLGLEQLLAYALEGEKAASGSYHGDNIIPCLVGGLNLITAMDPLAFVTLPIPDCYVALVHPEWKINTREARALLPPFIALEDHTKQSAALAAFISALYEKDNARLGAACVDNLIEPRRAHLIPYFYEIKEVAYQTGALACSISGAGPTLFALAQTREQAVSIAKAMQLHYKNREMHADIHISPIAKQGAYVIDSQ